MPLLTSTDFRGLWTRRFLANLLPLPPQVQLSIGDRPPDFTLPTVAAAPTQLSQYWQAQQPVIIAFTRIFTEQQYCPLCFPHLLALNKAYGDVRDLGVELLLITSTDQRQSQQVHRDLDLQMPLLYDPSCATFRAYGVGQALGAPLPAQFCLDRTGALRAHHLFSFLSPNAEVSALVQAAECLAAAA